MRLRHSFAMSVAIAAFLIGQTLRAENAFSLVPADGSPLVMRPMVALSGQKGDADVSATQALAVSPSRTIDPAGLFVEPGCCEHLDGVGCAECTLSDGSECDSCYKVRFVPYGWLFAVHGNATVRGLTAPIDLSIRDTLEIVETDADMLFMGKLEVEGNELGLIVNGFYFEAGFDNSIRRVDFNSTFTMAIADVAGTYNLMSEPENFSIPYLSRFDLLAGVRYWLLDGGLTVTGPLGNTRSASGDKEWVDPIIGGRIILPLTEVAEAQIRGDVGGFDWGTASEFTWNFEALAAVHCNEWLSLRGGYRILDVYNHRNSGTNRFGLDAQFRGPVVEVAIEF